MLANEEVTADGRSERGNFPVFKRPLQQWMMRITAYADRLLADLDRLDWPEPIKLMQRNWIGRATGALVDFDVDGTDFSIRCSPPVPTRCSAPPTWCWRPNTTLVDEITASDWPECRPEWRGVFGTDRSPAEAVAAYRESRPRKSELERTAEGRVRRPVCSPARTR